MGLEAGRPFVTVVIPARDAEDAIEATITSVLAQSYRPLEVVVVDDGSTDRTAEIARGIGDPVRVIEQAHGGSAAACNTGFTAARGSVIALIGVGEHWAPERLDRCVDRLLADARTGIVTTDAATLEPGRVVGHRFYDPIEGVAFPSREDQLDTIASRNFVFGSAVFDRRLLDVVGGGFDPNLSTAADHDLWTRFLLTGTEAVLVPEPLAWYPARPDTDNGDRLMVLEHHLPSLWLRGAHGRPQDAYAIARRVAARGERRLAIWFVAHALVDAGANPWQRLRYACGGAWAVVTAPRPRPSWSEA